MTDRDRDFIREVDEAVRQDQYKRLWDQYGVYALVALVLVVAGVAGYKGWAYWREREAGQAGAKFSQALAVSDAAKANEIFTALATDGPKGYRILSRFQLAAAAANAGDGDKADYAEMEKRLKPLIDSNSAWRFSARELLGLSAYRTNDMREAEKQFSTLLADQGTPPNLRERADMMLALIVGTPQALSTTAK